MSLPTLLIQVPSDNYSDSAVGISLVKSSIQLSQQTVESWNKVWGDVINPSGALWAGLCNLGTTLAAMSIILLAIKMAADYQEKRFLWSELAASFIYPLVIALFLGSNGYLLSQTVLIIRNIGHQQVVSVLDIQLADTTFRSAISNVTFNPKCKNERVFYNLR